MTLVAFFLTFLSAGFWAVFDAARKAMTDHMSVRVVTFWVAASSLPLYFAWAWQTADIPSDDYWVPATLSACINLAANGLFVFAVSRAPLGQQCPCLRSPGLLHLGSCAPAGEHLTARGFRRHSCEWRGLSGCTVAPWR